MESPVVLDKPPEYHGNDRGFPFEEEEGSGAWSELAARHPDIAARLRQRPATATWARKRRPSSQDATDDFGENFGSFDRFPFDDIPPEFREHFPSHFNRRFSSRDEPPPQPQASPPAQQPQQQTTATQTEQPQATDSQHQNPLPQYGLRNTVDLGQKSAVDPSVDADERNHRSMSAPPDQRPLSPKMSAPHSHTEQSQMPSQPEPSNVRHIPIFVEGRDEPVINKADHKQYNEPKQTFTPPQQPHIDREQYFADDPASFHHPPNFSRAFGTPFNKGFRQGPQPFVQQKVYPQSAFTRGASPQRSQSPKQPHDEHYVKVPVHHENTAPKTETPSKSQPKQTPPQPKQTPPQPKQTTPQQPPPPQREQTPPQPPKPSANDPITQILSIQTDVLNLMTEVENFTGSKKDKRYMFLDEMLTRNLIKLDNIETDGKENIRMARKEAIRCIQKCIAVLEAKAEKGSSMTQPQDVEMKENAEAPAANEASAAVENGEVEMKEEKETEPQVEQAASQEMKDETQPQTETQPEEIPKTQENQNPEAAPTTDTVQETTPAETGKPEEQNKDVEKQSSPTKKVVKKRDKSKDKAAVATVAKETNDKSNKAEETPALDSDKLEVMQIDTKGDKEQVMEVDGAASQ